MQASGAPEQADPPVVAGQLLAVWHRITGVASALYRLLDELDLTLPQLKALEALLEPGDEPSVKDLAERLGLSLPQASRTVEALCRRGYVDRREDAADRRVKRLRATPAGREVVAALEGARRENLERFAATLSPAQRAQLSAALAAVLEEDGR